MFAELHMEKPVLTSEIHVRLPVLIVLPSVVDFIKFSVHLEAFRKQMVAQTEEGVKGNAVAFIHHPSITWWPDDGLI